MNLADTQSVQDLSWRKRKSSSNNDLGSENFMRLSSLKQPKWSRPFFILAQESPPRFLDTDSDGTINENYHNCETDFCRDTSDTDSYTTDGIATVDVLEYEVATSSASEHLYSHDSSSGTDDFVTSVARAIFQSTASATSLEKLDDLLADIEESDGPTDPELGPADYWMCVKCKNRQNNPMYRYCEKCYQIRKSHFPPRPKKHRKNRSKNVDKRLPPSRAIYSSTDEDDEEQEMEKSGKESIDRKIGNSDNKSVKTFSKLSNTNRERLKRNSAGEASSTEYNEEEYQLPTIDLKSNRIDKTNSDLTGCVVVDKPMFQNIYMSQTTTKSDTEVTLSQMFVGKPNPPTQLNVKNDKESGFSSCSSQGISPITMTAPKDMLCSSQETYCSELETICDSDRLLSQQLSNLSHVSLPTSIACNLAASYSAGRNSGIDLMQFDDLTNLGNIQSESYSDTETRVASPIGGLSQETTASIDEKRFNDSNGMCIMCMTQPKNGVFVHSRVLHLCCCYQCAVKIWNKRKKCPVCNSKVKNVMKLFVH